MTFLLLKNYDHYAIVNDDADFIVGYVYPLNGRQGPYKVRADVGPIDRETYEAGVVNSLDEAIRHQARPLGPSLRATLRIGTQ